MCRCLCVGLLCVLKGGWVVGACVGLGLWVWCATLLACADVCVCVGSLVTTQCFSQSRHC